MWQLSLDRFVERNVTTVEETEEEEEEYFLPPSSSSSSMMRKHQIGGIITEENAKKVKKESQCDLTDWLSRNVSTSNVESEEEERCSCYNNANHYEHKPPKSKRVNNLYRSAPIVTLPTHTYRFEEMFSNPAYTSLGSPSNKDCKANSSWSETLHCQQVSFLRNYYQDKYAERDYFKLLLSSSTLLQETQQTEELNNVNTRNMSSSESGQVIHSYREEWEDEWQMQRNTHGVNLHCDHEENIKQLTTDIYNSVLIAVKQGKLEVYSLEQLKEERQRRLSGPLERTMTLTAQSTMSDLYGISHEYIPSFTFGFSATAFLSDSLDIVCAYQSAPFVHVFDLEAVDEHHAIPRTSFNLICNHDNTGTHKPFATDITACTSHVSIAALSSGVTTWLDERVGKPLLCTPLLEKEQQVQHQRHNRQSTPMHVIGHNTNSSYTNNNMNQNGSVVNSNNYGGSSNFKEAGLTSVCVVRPGSLFNIITGNKCGDVVLWDLRHTRQPITLYRNKTQISQLTPHSLRTTTTCSHWSNSEATTTTINTINTSHAHPVVWFTSLSGILTALCVGASEMTVCVEQKLSNGHRQDRIAHLPPVTPVVDQDVLYCVNYTNNVIDIFDSAVHNVQVAPDILKNTKQIDCNDENNDNDLYIHSFPSKSMSLTKITSIHQRDETLSASCCLPLRELDTLVIGNLSGDLTFALTNELPSSL